jgi:hypothetical protein
MTASTAVESEPDVGVDLLLQGPDLTVRPRPRSVGDVELDGSPVGLRRRPWCDQTARRPSPRRRGCGRAPPAHVSPNRAPTACWAVSTERRGREIDAEPPWHPERFNVLAAFDRRAPVGATARSTASPREASRSTGQDRLDPTAAATLREADSMTTQDQVVRQYRRRMRPPRCQLLPAGRRGCRSRARRPRHLGGQSAECGPRTRRSRCRCCLVLYLGLARPRGGHDG